MSWGQLSQVKLFYTKMERNILWSNIHGQIPCSQVAKYLSLLPCGQTSYGQTSYGQTSYGQTSYDQTFYGQTSYGQTS